MKSEILVKSTAALEKEIIEDMKVEEKDISEIIDEELRRTGVSGCDSPDNEQNKEEV